MVLFLLVAVQELRIGIDDDQTGGAVDDDGIVCPDLSGYLLQSHHRRDGDGSSHNGRMGGLAAHVGGKTQHLVDHHLGGIGGRQIRSNDDHPLPQGGDLFLTPAGKIAEDHLPDITDVAEAVPQVFVIHFLKNVAVFINSQTNRPLRVYRHFANPLDHVGDK